MDEKLLTTFKRKDSLQKNAFHIAAENGDLDAIQSLVKDLDESSMKETIKESQSVLGGLFSILADSYNRAENGTSIFTDTLLKAEDSLGRQPLHYAARNGHIEVVKFLLSKKSYIDATDNRGHTPLCLAAFYGQVSVVNLLLEKRAKIKLEPHFYSTENNHNTPLHLAASANHLTILVSLNEYSTKMGQLFIHVKNKNGYTPIHMAALYGHHEVVNYLIQKGAHFNKKKLYRDTDYYAGFTLDTPLMFAAAEGHIGAVKVLLNNNASLNDFNVNGDTALHFCCRNQHKEIIALLLSVKADTNVKNHQDELALNLVKDREWLHSILSKNGQQKIEHEIPLDSIEQPHYQYALISIMSSYKETAICSQLKGPELNKHQFHEKTLRNQYRWKPLETSEEFKINACGYFGVAYYKCHKNTKTAEIVIAHRGTCFDKAGNVLADLKIMEKEKPEILEKAAFLYVNGICKKYSEIIINNEAGTKIPVTKITHVGFSLGGYIAAACALLSNAADVNAVTFDAPGCDYLGNFNQQTAKRVINYVTTPNLVNTANTHVGEVRRLSSFPEVNDKSYTYENTPLKLEVINMSTFQQLLSTLESHSLEKIITDTEKLAVLRYEKVYKWPIAKNTVIYQEQKLKEYYYFPGGHPIVNFGYALFQAATALTSDAIWEMTKKKTDAGKVVGLLAVEHERNDLIFYSEEEYNSHVANNSSSKDIKFS